MEICLKTNIFTVNVEVLLVFLRALMCETIIGLQIQLNVFTHGYHKGNGALINPRGACAARVTVVVLCAVTTFSATVRNKSAKKPYQRVQRYTGFI